MPSPLPLPDGFPTQVFVEEALDPALLPGPPWTLLGDAAVRPLWREAGMPEPEGSLWVELDESTKRLGTLEPWMEGWARLPLHREATLLAVGGGVLSDMAGLAAALYLRGIRWHCWPTTLLAQVDAGLGGKTAVNLGAGKNLAGAFHPPARLVVSRAFLRTLPPREVAAGRWELVKMALMAGDEAWASALLAEPVPAPADLARGLEMKAGVVHRDLREQGERRLLNLGHTLGHALEVAGNHTLRHGEAVGLGTLAACFLAESQGLPPFSRELLDTLARALQPLASHLAPWEACRPLLARDKKALSLGSRGTSAIHCILPLPGETAHQRLLPPEAWAPAHSRLVATFAKLG
jgi:3-dehydroquinate synthase